MAILSIVMFTNWDRHHFGTIITPFRLITIWDHLILISQNGQVDIYFVEYKCLSLWIWHSWITFSSLTFFAFLNDPSSLWWTPYIFSMTQLDYIWAVVASYRLLTASCNVKFNIITFVKLFNIYLIFNSLIYLYKICEYLKYVTGFNKNLIVNLK